ncbi:transcription factor bHLH94-like [Apium graveolens]|uniref:transcription factor bHLH94-like n=1 Tax=Apium graveolens TaxID=4045 RepID=UPI003D7ADD51
MALETVVFQQDPFTSTYGCEDFYKTDYSGGKNYKKSGLLGHFEQYSPSHNSNNMISSAPPPMAVQSSYVKDSSPKSEKVIFTTEGFFTESYPPPGKLSGSRRKRTRVKASKNKEEVENQRMTHIAVERNRRRQMNDYLSLLRSMMPPSYAQRGDQGSIVAGAINYVKELEQHLQYMESQKLKDKNDQDEYDSILFDNFFAFPQYSTHQTSSQNNLSESSAEADIEVTMVESHANIKILSIRQPKQLFKMVSGFQSMGLTILHLNITTVDHRVLYSFNLKVEDDCQLTTVNEIATAVHEMVVMIKDEAIFC